MAELKPRRAANKLVEYRIHVPPRHIGHVLDADCGYHYIFHDVFGVPI